MTLRMIIAAIVNNFLLHSLLRVRKSEARIVWVKGKKWRGYYGH